jgi:ribose/xylose/arabinose/galactoside ABC-type transport system permease subunit
VNRRDALIDLAIRAAFMAIIYLVFALQLPNYHTSSGIAALLDGAVLVGIVSIGVGVTMIAGEFDLSVGSLAALTGVIALEIISIGVLPALVMGVLFAAVVGAIQGFLIGVLGINSLVFTIGTLIGLRGLAMVVAHEQTITMPIEQLPDVDFLTEHFLDVFSPISIGMIVVFAAVGMFLTYTRWGREIYAIGGGRSEARAAGVPLLRPMMIAFTLSGALAGLSGALLSIRLGSATPLGFDSLLLSAATTCLMGGIALEGGIGGVIGIAIGLFTLRFLVTGMAALGAPYYVQNLAVGALLILVVVVQLIVSRLRRRRARTQLSIRIA